MNFILINVLFLRLDVFFIAFITLFIIFCLGFNHFDRKIISVLKASRFLGYFNDKNICIVPFIVR